MTPQTIIPAPDGVLSDYLNKGELAREIRRTPRSLDRMILHGDGPPYIRLGNRKLFRREAVREWLLSRETPGRPQSNVRRSAR